MNLLFSGSWQVYSF